MDSVLVIFQLVLWVNRAWRDFKKIFSVPSAHSVFLRIARRYWYTSIKIKQQEVLPNYWSRVRLRCWARVGKGTVQVFFFNDWNAHDNTRELCMTSKYNNKRLARKCVRLCVHTSAWYGCVAPAHLYGALKRITRKVSLCLFFSRPISSPN